MAVCDTLNTQFSKIWSVLTIKLFLIVMIIYCILCTHYANNFIGNGHKSCNSKKDIARATQQHFMSDNKTHGRFASQWKDLHQFNNELVLEHNEFRNNKDADGLKQTYSRCSGSSCIKIYANETQLNEIANLSKSKKHSYQK